ncbi:hypothetical protein TRIUR3_24082 [Triticum urartu]|uniref:Knottins-like domain-containing protein n=2 Tax=Triticum TaxID=4564 RepID=M8A8T7_TRIUA|nr:hypothetical protein TRIUR3_24082 [Triticum urartu]VAI78992.1 unnamed protein product [Triticum turgidum subsp. durum]
MEVHKVKMPGLCLVLLMAALLLPGSEGKICKEYSKTYTVSECTSEPCVEHCHNEGFTEGECKTSEYELDDYRFCLCKKHC